MCIGQVRKMLATNPQLRKKQFPIIDFHCFLCQNHPKPIINDQTTEVLVNKSKRAVYIDSV